MVLQLTPEQAQKNRHGKTILSYMGDDVILWAKVGTLEHFGFDVEDASLDLGSMGIDQVVTRKAHRRSRWLGDTAKSTVKEHQAIRMFYPSRRGVALPGEPIVMENLTTHDKWTFQMVGQIGVLVAALTQSTNPFDIQLWGPTGNRYLAPILKGAPPAGTAVTAGGPTKGSAPQAKP